MTSPREISSSVLLTLISFNFLLVSSRCRPSNEEPTPPRDPNATESSEYVFSPEKDYVNKDEIAKMLKVDSRPADVGPFDSLERRWNTPSTPESPWKRAKIAVKKLFGLHRTTVKHPWNVTKEQLGDYLIRKAKTFHHYVKFTLLKHTTLNGSIVTEPSTEDPLNFWRAHYTDWNYFNKLHFEIMAESDAENHWFYRTLMKEGYGVNLDEIVVTTPMEFDIHRMDGFSTNVTMANTDLDEHSDIDNLNSEEFPPEVREVLNKSLTMRPAFEKAINELISSFDMSTIPNVEIHSNQPMFVDHSLYKKLQNKLASFYYITTRDPDEWMDTREQIKSRKMKKWLVKEEKRLHASVEKHLESYTVDFGPKFNSWYADLLKHTSTDITLETKNEEFTEKEEEHTTQYEPPFVRQAFKEGRMVNATLLARWIWEHCSNNTIPWETSPPPTRPSVVTYVVTETPETKTETTEPPPEIITIPEFLFESNLTIDNALVDKMVANAHKHMRNLSLLRIDENWHRVSEAIHEAKFTTERTIDYESAQNLFTHKLGNY